MKLTKTLLGAAVMSMAVITAAPSAIAHEAKIGELTIAHPQARPNMPNRPTAAYMAISNDGEIADRLLSATSEAFGTIELHVTKAQDGVMMMMPVDGIDIPAGDTVLLEPGGLHLMLFDGAERFKIGDSFELSLTFENAGDVVVEVKVEKITGGMHHGHEGHGSSGHSGHSGHKQPATQ